MEKELKVVDVVTEEPKKSNGKKALKIGGIVAGVLLLVAGVCGLASKKDHDDETEDELVEGEYEELDRENIGEPVSEEE